MNIIKTLKEIIENLEDVECDNSYDCYGCCNCCSNVSNQHEAIQNQLQEIITELESKNITTNAVKLDFTYEVDDNGVMTVYYIYEGEWHSICEIAECNGLPKSELDSIADECLFDLSYVNGDYFQADTDEQAKDNVIPREME